MRHFPACGRRTRMGQLVGTAGRMCGERWQRIKDVFAAALESPEEDREASLRKLCGDDEELHQEVASLIASHHQAAHLFSRPGAPTAPVRLEGRRIGPYRLLRDVGHGGM